jgi:hypothetical protein
MVLEIPLIRQAFDQVLTNEIRKVIRALRAFPIGRLDERGSSCGRTPRELAEGFVTRLQRISKLANGHVAEHAVTRARPRGAILMDLEIAFIGAHSSLEAATPAQWSEVIPTPRGLSPWHQARRGELLWLALHDLMRHHHHFTLHAKSECTWMPRRDDGRTGPPAVLEPLAPIGAGA